MVKEIKSEHEISAHVWKRVRQNYKLAGDMELVPGGELCKGDEESQV